MNKKTTQWVVYNKLLNATLRLDNFSGGCNEYIIARFTITWTLFW